MATTAVIDLADDMLAHDTITLDELEHRLEDQRRAAHELVALLSSEQAHEYAPCSDALYRVCPLRCVLPHFAL